MSPAREGQSILVLLRRDLESPALPEGGRTLSPASDVTR